MVRKSVMVLIVVAVSGLVPLMASWGSCADMPCCRHQVAIDVQNGCSTPFACLKEAKPLPPTHLTAQRSTIAIVVVATALETTTVIQQITPRHWSPPRSTAERLSTLSTLLI